MAHVVVTGASGHLGSSLVRQLLARGDRVRVMLRQEDPESLRGLEVDRVPGDVRDPGSLRQAFEGCEILYHLAAVISIVGDMDGLVPAVNVDGARNVGQAALDCGLRRMVHMCSVHAFQQDPLDEGLDETRARVGPDGLPYDRSKAGGEAEIRKLVAEGLDAVILHPSGIVGPFDFGPSRMGQVFLDLFHRKLPSLVEGGFDWVDARDVASSAIAAAERGRTNESYMVSGHYWTLREIARLVKRLTDVEPPRFTSPVWLARLGAPFMEAMANLAGTEPLYTRESIAALQANRNYVRTKAFKELGHDPRPIETSVRDTYAWFASRGQVPGIPEALMPPAYGAVLYR